MKPEYDVIIVGGGVAGALVADRLSRRPGLKVLILDVGSNQAGSDGPDRAGYVEAHFDHPKPGLLTPYRKLASATFAPSPDGGVDVNYFEQVPSTGTVPFKSNYMRMLGGTTWIWRGNCPRFIPSDFRLKSLYGVADDWPVTYDELEPYYCLAEDELGVSGNHAQWNGLHGGHRSRPFPMPEIVPALGDQFVKRAITGLDIDGRRVEILSTPQARNSEWYQGRPPCQGNANCIPICPSGAKYDAGIHLRRAVAQGVEIRLGHVVTRLEARKRDGRVEKVHFKNGLAGPNPPEEHVTGRVVILAINAIETSRLWLDSLASGMRNASDQVGRNLMDHLAEEVVGLFPDPVYPFRGPQNTSGIEAFRDGDFRRTHGAFRMTVGNDGWGRTESPFKALDKEAWDGTSKRLKLFGRELPGKVAQRVTRFLRIGYSTEMLPVPENRVTLSTLKTALGIARPKIETHLDDYSKGALAYGRDVALRIWRSIPRVDLSQIIAQGEEDFKGAGHPMGTCRMGLDPTTSVVDPYGQAHEHRNLYLVGSSVFVTGSTANPTITLAALAIRTAEALARSL